MKILIVSDTHGYLENLDIVLEREKPIDMLIHCGDVERDEAYMRVNAGCPVYMVAGNNDWGMALEREIRTEIGGHQVMITHGHTYLVSLELDTIAAEAKKKGAEIVMFGHTHKPVIREVDGVTLVNPGSISQPRQAERIPTYAVMEIDDDGKVNFSMKELKKDSGFNHAEKEKNFFENREKEDVTGEEKPDFSRKIEGIERIEKKLKKVLTKWMR